MDPAENTFNYAENGQSSDAVFPYFAVMNLLSVDPQFTRVGAGLFAYGALEYLILHCQNLTRNYPLSRYIKQCDCIDTAANEQALLNCMKPVSARLKQRKRHQARFAETRKR
jgi:hypothetical protein